jgi:hypothetical protein
MGRESQAWPGITPRVSTTFFVFPASKNQSSGPIFLCLPFSLFSLSPFPHLGKLLDLAEEKNEPPDDWKRFFPQDFSMTSVHPTDTWADSPYPVKGAFSPFTESPHAPFESRSFDAGDLLQKVHFDQALAEIGEKLTFDLPGFLALYVSPLLDRSPAPSLSLGLVTRHPLTPSTQRTLKMAIGRFLGIPRICLGCWVPQNLRSEILKDRAGLDLLLQGSKVTGNEDPLAAIGAQFAQSPAPQAALSELKNAFEALLRFPPAGDKNGPRLAPSPQDFHPNIGPVLAIEHLTNAMLLKLGAYTPSVEERREVLRQHYPLSPSRLKLLLWGLDGGLGEAPLDQVEAETSSKSEILWHQIRNLCLGLYVSIRFPEAEMEIDAPKHPIYKEVSLPKTRLGKWWRKLRGPKKSPLGLDPHGLLLLALVLAKTGPEKENKNLCTDIADLLPNLGGGILAHPSWENLRKEAMILQPMVVCGSRDFLSAV